MAAGDKIQNVNTFEEAFDNIKAMNWKQISENNVSPKYTSDLRKGQHSLYNATFHHCGNKSNNLQFAIAQFAIAHSKKYRR
jgi:hypothetical protein